MAEETEKILIFSIELDLSQFEANAKAAEKDLETLLVKQALLREENKQGTVEYNALGVAIQKTRKELKDNAAAIETVKKIQKENTGSIKEMRQELSVATLQYNNLSKAERENASVGGKLAGQIKKLTDDLKANGKAIGDNRMNVGNYEQAIQGALNQTNLFGGGISQLAGMLSSGGIWGVSLAAAVGAAKLFGDALLSIDSNADVMEQKIAGAGAALKSFTGTIARGFGGSTGVTTTKFLGDFLEAFALIPSALIGATDSAEDAINITEKLTAATQSLDDAERDASVTMSANNILIDKFIARSKNVSLEYEERIDILKQASTLEEENLKRQQAIADARLSIIKVENELNKRNQAGELGDDQKQREVDAINRINALRQESLTLQEKIASRIAQIANKANEEADAAAKKSTEDLIKELREREKQIKEANDREIADNKRKQNELKNIGKLTFVDDYKNVLNQRKETTEIFNAEEELAVKEKYANGLINEQLFTEEMVKIKAEGLRRELELLELNNATELTLDNDVALKKIEIATLLADSQIKENERVTKEHEEEVKKRIAQEKEYNKVTTDFIADLGIAFGESLTQQGLDVEKFGEKVVLVVLDTLEKTVLAAIASATAQSYAQSDSVATYGITGTARAAILAGLITAAFEVAKSSIKNSSFEKGGIVPKGERGMIIGGKPHSQGGTKFYGSDGTRFEAERDEAMIIINKRDTERLKYYSNINSRHGVDFYKGNGTSTYLQDGGFAARSVSSSVDQAMSQQQLMSNLPPMIVLVEDINSAQGTLVRVKSKAQF